MYSCGCSVPAGPLGPGGGEGVGYGSSLGEPARASAATVVAPSPDPAAGPLGECPAGQRPRLAFPTGPGESPPGGTGRRSGTARDIHRRHAIAPRHGRIGRLDDVRGGRGLCVEGTPAIRLPRG